MLQGKLQAMFTVSVILLVIISASMSFPADHQPGYDSYRPDNIIKERRAEEPLYPSYDNSPQSGGARKGRRGYNYGAGKEERRDGPSYYGPNDHTDS